MRLYVDNVLDFDDEKHLQLKRGRARARCFRREMDTAADGDVPLPLLNRFQEENEVNDLIGEMQSICDDELALEANAEKFVG